MEWRRVKWDSWGENVVSGAFSGLNCGLSSYIASSFHQFLNELLRKTERQGRTLWQIVKRRMKYWRGLRRWIMVHSVHWANHNKFIKHRPTVPMVYSFFFVQKHFPLIKMLHKNLVICKPLQWSINNKPVLFQNFASLNSFHIFWTLKFFKSWFILLQQNNYEIQCNINPLRNSANLPKSSSQQHNLMTPWQHFSQFCFQFVSCLCSCTQLRSAHTWFCSA